MMISYISRLGYANGCTNVQDFINYFFFEPDGRKKHYCNDYFCGLEILACVADLQTPLQLLENTTLLPAVFPLLPRSMQDRYIRRAFSVHQRLGSDKLNLITPKLLYCPECMENDGYLHRIHNLPGIYYCPKHRHRLRYVEDQSEIVPEVSYEAQEHYQGFFVDLLQNWLRTDYTISRKALITRISELTEISPYEYLSSILKGYGIKEYSGKRLSSSLNSYMPGIPLSILVMLFGTVFPNVETFNQYLDSSDQAENHQIISTYGYEILQATSYGVVHVTHHDCGLSFYTTENSILEGWRCGFCDSMLTDDELFQQIVYFKGHGEYQIIHGYHGLHKKVVLKHTCGNHLEVSASRYLYYGSRCSCFNTISESEASKAIEALGPYKLICYQGTDKDASFCCTECGHEFRFHYKKFIQHPCCKICSPRCPDEETFINEIQALTRDEYTLASTYHKRLEEVELLHRTCGRIFRMRPSHFLNGHRCPYCIKQYRKPEFESLVDKYSSGRYKVTGYTGKNKAIVTDTISGNTRTDERAFIIQELTRPTPSEIYPHIPLASLPPISNAEKVIEAIKKTYPSPDSQITAEGIEIPDLSRKQINRIMANQLTKLCFLDPIDKGTYKYYTKEETKHE